MRKRKAPKASEKCAKKMRDGNAAEGNQLLKADIKGALFSFLKKYKYKIETMQKKTLNLIFAINKT